MMWSSGGERRKKQMVISGRELNQRMMEHCSFKAIWIMLVCLVHMPAFSQDASRFSRGNLTKLNHQAGSSWETVRLCTSSIWFLQFNHFCVFLFLFFDREWTSFESIPFPNFFFSVKNSFKDTTTSTQLNSESAVPKDHRESLKSYLSGPPCSSRAQ